jgi:hypothetical protein
MFRMRRSWRSAAVGPPAPLLRATTFTAQTTHGAWTAAVRNTSSRAGTGTLAYTHRYASGPSCSGSGTTASVICTGAINPTVAITSATTAVTATDSIQYTGTVPAASYTQQAQLASCGPVSLANRVTPANPMVSRYGTTYSTSDGPMTGSGSITLNGASTAGGYETSIVAQSQPAPTLSVQGTTGLGIWFRTTDISTGGPLFGFGSNPIDLSGGGILADRILYMDRNGKLGFILNTGGAATTMSSLSYRDKAWHFAYVSLTQLSVSLGLGLGLGVLSTVTLYVDGVSVASGGGLLVGLSSYSGYWHVGESQVSGLAAAPSNYFAGSLSNFVVLNNDPAPNPLSVSPLPTQAAFTASLGASATEHWVLNDTGTTNTALTLPVLGTISPCSMINMSWSLTNPLSCPTSQSTVAACATLPGVSLSSFLALGWVSTARPAPGATQVSTVSAVRGATYSAAFMPGLRLYAPLGFRGTAGGWSVAFSWPSAPASFIA